MMLTIKELKRASQVKELRRLWNSATWIRRTRSKRDWFQHDYQWIRREVRRAKLIGVRYG